MEAIVHFIVESVNGLGYAGIFLLMFLESSFFPFPSEVVMIPAGYLAFQGEMNLTLAILAGTAGSLGGALFNYFLAMRYGRAFLLRYGKYFFISEATLHKMDDFFERHGHISTFSGRLIPGVRQYISLPAGIARMDLKIFSAFTTLGAGIWVVVLALLGYIIGENESLIKEYLHQITAVTLGLIIILIAVYVKFRKRPDGDSSSQS